MINTRKRVGTKGKGHPTSEQFLSLKPHLIYPGLELYCIQNIDNMIANENNTYH